MRLITRLGFCLFVFLCSSLTALNVNRLNGGLSITYVDFSLPGNPVPLELGRSYNSISAANENTGWLGAFGWGWTTAFETTLTTTPERNVILRDGATGNTLFFKPEKEDPKVREVFFKAVRTKYFEKKLGRPLTETQLSKLTLPAEMERQLRNDPEYRLQIATKYGISSAVPKDEVLVSTEYGYQTLRFKGGRWYREKDTFVQTFDKEGRLVRQEDRAGFAFDYKYSSGPSGHLAEIHSSDKANNLKLTFTGDRITKIVDSKNHTAIYAYDAKGNMVQSSDSSGTVYQFRYENKKFPHLITQVIYLNESSADKPVTREFKYDDNALVTEHRDKDGALTTYSYGKIQGNPENNFWTRTVTKIAGKTEETYDEFLIKARSDGSKYLHKQDSKSASGTTSTIFTSCCGKPLQVTKNGQVTNFKYYENGLLKERSNETETVSLEYDPRWKKITKVVQNGFTSLFEYDNRGNLTRARNSKNENVSLAYDRQYRILEMTDPGGRRISFKYDDQGRPAVIAERGVGTIRLTYDAEGQIRSAESVGGDGQVRKPSAAKSQEVVKRVMQSFQHLLDILRPAGASYAA